MTIAEALDIGTSKIGRRDAMLLLSHITDKPNGHIMLHEGDGLNVAAEKSYLDFLARRQTGEPLQYIIGNWEFMGQTLKTDHRALIPRPETELLVEEAFYFIRSCPPPINVLDLCTGSGCIAIAIASMAVAEGIDVEMTAVDKSGEALKLAKENAKSLGLKINYIESDLFSALEAAYGEGRADFIRTKANSDSLAFDIIISNPPYIPTAEIQTLDPVVRDHEPHMALDGGTDGMDFYRKIIPQSQKLLRQGGALCLEIGPAAVESIMIDAGYKDVKLINDYANLPRILRGINRKENKHV